MLGNEAAISFWMLSQFSVVCPASGWEVAVAGAIPVFLGAVSSGGRCGISLSSRFGCDWGTGLDCGWEEAGSVRLAGAEVVTNGAVEEAADRESMASERTGDFCPVGAGVA